MSRLGLRTSLLSLGVLSIVLGLAPAAAAHPLGNSSTNLHSGLIVESGRLVVDHVVDLAEIRTVQLVAAADRDGDRQLDAAERTAHAAQACEQVAEAITLRVDGDEVEVRPDGSGMELAPGQGGLSVARLGCTLVAPLAIDGVTRIEYRDDSFAGRFGWREVTAVGNGTTLVSSDVPAESPTDRLLDYPPETERSVPDVRSASLQVRAGGRASESAPAALGVPAGVLPRGVDVVTQRFVEFVSRREMTLGFGVLAVLLAVVLGSGHALAPGHGKTVMAAYLVGQEGTRRQALLLGGVVTLTHTAGVLLLGFLLLVSTTLAPDRLLPLLEVASGALLAGVGVYLLRRAVGRRRALAALQSHGHHHDPGHHDGHGHGHHHDPGHHHGHGDDRDHHDHDHDPGHHHPDRDPLTPNAPARTDVLTVPSAAVVATDPVPAARVVAVDHDHGFGRHTHVLPDPARPLGARSLAAMGVAGGLVPSPSALVVLLGATALGRAWFGVLLVLAYGVGMALTLTAAGLALLRARRLLDRVAKPGSAGAQRWVRGTRVLAALPILTAVVIVGVGLLLVTRGALAAAGVG
ncbi:MAG: nickel transporter [Actinomycetota bacterium]|nr:nickel transporter [Actinomycetota bacterium]